LNDNREAWHHLTVEETLEKLDTSTLGLREREAERRLEEHGLNELEEKKGVRKIDILASQLKNPLNLVLVAAALISYLGGKTIDTVVIAIIIGFNAAMGFIQEYRAEKAIESLRSMVSPEVDVLRRCDEDDDVDCYETRIDARKLVPGDIIIVEAGDKVPADCRLLETNNLEVDESFLTGESLTVAKTTKPLEKEITVADRTNIVFSGSSITRGNGKAVVFATGMNTEIGKIAEMIKETEKGDAPIQRRTKDLSIKLGIFAVVASSITLMLGLVRGFEFFDILSFSLAAAVSSIPEGLLVVMTITLSIGANRMVRRNALIRRLNAVETLGSITVICSDKTGTLTTNQMTVRRIATLQEEVEVTGVGFAPEGSFQIDGEDTGVEEGSTIDHLLRGATLCNNARFRKHVVEGEDRWEVIGDPTEGSLIVAAAKASINQDTLREKNHRLDEIPFDPERRFMITFHESPDGVRAYAKGAPEVILEMCSSYLFDGERKELSNDLREKMIEKSYEMAGEALRVLGVACLDLKDGDVEEFKESLESGDGRLVLLGLIGMMDPPRGEVKDSIKLCKTAGIRVIMSTGDHRKTAEAIAAEIGIIEPGSKVLTGDDLDEMTDEELDDALKTVSVFARVSPSHKNRIVGILEGQGHVVGMTGDGVNDTPALEAADVAIAMGITGTDVTKEVSDMVLTDDNFASIVNAVKEGRAVFDNIRKVVKYLVTTNTGEIITILTALVIFPDYPLILTPIMILWINLVTDGLLDKTLALEAKEEDIMRRSPRDPDVKIIDRRMVQNVLILGVLMAVVTLFLFDSKMAAGDAKLAQTTAFVTMAMFQVYNALNCRSRNQSVFRLGFAKNKWLLVAMLTSFSLLVLATTVPALQVGLGTVSLELTDWIIIIVLTSSIFVVDEIRKFISTLIGRGSSDSQPQNS
jgi:Ca2+-transporting ATPase